MREQINSVAWFLVAVGCLCFKTAVAQDSSHQTPKPVFIQASLLYDFPQSYGIAAGVSFPLRSVIKNRVSKKGKTLTVQRDKVAGVDLAFYRYPFNSTRVFLAPFIGLRRPLSQSFFYEPSAGIGLLRTFYDGRVYEVNAAGNVNEKAFFGRWYGIVNFSWGFDFVTQEKEQSIWVLQLKPMLWFQYPYNSFIKPHITVEFGIKYKIASRNVLIRRTTKYKKR